MADFPLLIHQQATLGAGQRATLSFQPGADEVFVVTDWQFISTGAFLLLAVRDSSGNQYVSDQAGTGISSGFFDASKPGATAFLKLDPPIEVGPLGVLFIDVQDASSASNTVRVLLRGIRRKG